ncbi:dephospho-CoA kinase domain-containing protein-like [Macrosteles quadrilineatus]|uniref:dephospho-CoA kinase domain-containing protein-like n=1 Tax=Macrosteles quadrilineatus TaxID=74068 RepID=UPI0023E113BE|nr:dephospho-CoA kinase domain-containing protein-like [Macrosteles quadrilineatus]XP_054272174.1 dephospho-CoA kinase domain-containing protein-like [Macrosteles quadrilineatus]
MFIVGLTGGISTGKSTVSEMFEEYGIPVIDADKMARKVVEPGKVAWKKIRQEFGEEVFHPSGELNREALGDIIFDDPKKRRKLNEITHPEIYKELLWAAVRCFFQGHQFIVMDLPLLFESGAMLDYIHKIIVVTCEEDIQLMRLIERGNLTETRAKKRIASQMALDQKCERAHYVIENSGSVDDTREQVTRIVAALKCSRHHWRLRIIAGLFCSGVVSFIIWLGTRMYQNRITQ